MRRFFFAGFIALVALCPAVAQDAPKSPAPKPPAGAAPADKADKTKPAQPAKSREERLNDLFARLAKAQDAAESNGISNQIQKIWRQSGSDTADLLLDRADQAMNDKKFELGLDVLDSVIALKPDWAEAWNRRATLLYMKDDYDGSMRDIARVLKLEPRHFGALAGMAMIFANMGDLKRAVRVGREALKINPQMEDLKQMVDRNALQAEGNGI
jgi:tetratricopeptide (TPR) repeat protein